MLQSVLMFERPSPGRMCLSAFLSGLALTNQHTAILYIAPTALLLLFYHSDVLLRPRHLLSQFVAFLAGLLPYFYLVYASAQKRLNSWGDLTTIRGFLRHLLREEVRMSFWQAKV